MTSDDQAIRNLVALWHSATAAGDVDTVLTLLSEDVIFLGVGRPPMRGRSSFEGGLRKLLAQHRIESTGDVQEVEVSGALAYCWTNLTVRIVPLSGGETNRSRRECCISSSQAAEWLVGRGARRQHVACASVTPNRLLKRTVSSRLRRLAPAA